MTYMLLGLSIHLYNSQVIECDVYTHVANCLIYDCVCVVILVSSVLLKMSLF